MPASREDRHLDHRVAFAPADHVELEVDQVVIAREPEQLREAAGKDLRRPVDVPVGEVEERAAFHVVEQGPETPDPVVADLPVGLDDRLGVGVGIVEQL